MSTENPTPTTPEAPSSRKNPYVVVSLFIFLIALAIPIYSIQRYAKTLEDEVKNLSKGLVEADCGVVLTGGAGRVREGISLLSHKQIQKLVISGVHQHNTLAEMFPEILFYPEIKLENVILERRSNTTAGNAQSSLPVVEALACQSILLITSDYHMYRAHKTFLQVFPGAIKVIPYAVDSDRFHFRSKAFFDSRYWGTVVEEWAKYIFYEVFVFSG